MKQGATESREDTNMSDENTESAVTSQVAPPTKKPLPRNFTLGEQDIKTAIREYVGRLNGVNPHSIAVGLTVKRRDWFGGRGDFAAPIEFVDLEALRNRARR